MATIVSFYKAKNKSLSILNGGALKHLDHKDIQYYYDNLTLVIKALKDPLDKYTSIQEIVADEIKKIGGSGKIHGCIVDIDYYNHIYVNPNDLKITGYYAENIINKTIYPSIPMLLEDKCPELYTRYIKLLKDNKKDLPSISSTEKMALDVLPQIFRDTEMYKASREIKKMQKLHSNILSTWYEVNPNNLLS